MARNDARLKSLWRIRAIGIEYAYDFLAPFRTICFRERSEFPRIHSVVKVQAMPPFGHLYRRLCERFRRSMWGTIQRTTSRESNIRNWV